MSVLAGIELKLFPSSCRSSVGDHLLNSEFVNQGCDLTFDEVRCDVRIVCKHSRSPGFLFSSLRRCFLSVETRAQPFPVGRV
jgi:hypothetical protein